MPSKDDLDFSWFYDAEQHEHSCSKDFSAEEIARRPWKAFWPPRSEDNVAVWLRSEFPEVLLWRFDPDQPFDQPWRHWLKSSLMGCEAGNHQLELSLKDGYRSEEHHYLEPLPFEDQIAGLPRIKVESFTYLAPVKLYDTQKLYFSQLPCGSPLPRTNLAARGYPVEIRDICGKESLFKLDEAGFQFLQFPAKVTDWTDETVQSEYLPQLSAWLQYFFKCEKVFIYNYNLRTSDTELSGKGPWRSPIFRAHCDNTAESCAKRLEFQFPTEAKELSQKRYRYIDIWRCTAGPDIDSPLAFCDIRTVRPTDLRKIDIVYPHFAEEGYEVAYNPNHQWFYKKGMSKDDIVVFKLDDNSTTAAKFAPHAAFVDPTASGSCKRTSIEVRAIILG